MTQSDIATRDRAGYGEALAAAFHLPSAPTFVTRTLRQSAIAITEIRCSVPDNGLTGPLEPEDALLLQLQLADCPAYELWLDGQALPTAPLAAGDVCLYDLRSKPVANSISPFHSLNFYLPGRALDAIAEMEGSGPRRDLALASNRAIEDSVVRSLGMALLPAFQRPDDANRLLIDHVALALGAHLLHRHLGAGRTPSTVEGVLSPVQSRRVLALLDSRLDAEISIAALARECGLPPTRFLSAFRAAHGQSPQQWLQRRRIEKAKELLRGTDLPLADIARACGFAGVQPLARAFERRVGASPSRWRAEA